MMNRGFALVLAGLALLSCTPAQVVEDGPMRSFASDAEFENFARKMVAEAARQRVAEEGVMYDAAAPADAAQAEPAAEEAAPAAEADTITNVQEAGVDEGGIVKAHGDFLVVLRRGRLFTVRHGDGALDPVDTIDAFPPGDREPGDTWYDEMLVAGNTVVVIGYSYGDNGTEVSRFELSSGGQLTYRDTHYLTSGDYYSSSNYASRLIGDQLVFYAPVYVDWADWRDSLPGIRKRRANGSIGPAEATLQATDIYVPEEYRDQPSLSIGMLHTVTRCDLSAAELDCASDAVLGGWSRSFYVSADAAYVWTATGDYGPAGKRTADLLLRLPLDGSAPGAVGVHGAPVDQFSFMEDAGKNQLNLVLRDEGYGDAMWASEVSDGDVALLTVPFDRFGNGWGTMPREAYRPLPAVAGYSFQNRFVGRHLLYAASDWGDEARSPKLHAVFLDGDEVAAIELPHGVTRLDRIAGDGIAIGPSRNGGLGFSAIALDSESGRASLENSYIMPAAGEGESRSQAFFFRPDRGGAAGNGTLGLPITRRLDQRGYEFLGNGSGIAFLRRSNRQLSPAGELDADIANARDDNCRASCVDWYGNARPIFLGERIFALMGYEIVEGRLAGGRIGEVRRMNFAP
jgi:hypothetical protein